MVMRVNRKLRLGALIVAGASALACQSGQPSAGGGPTGAAGSLPAGKPSVQAASELQAGEYLTIIGGCNDCHTEGWSESKGKVAPADRMSGMKVGFRGSWGTVYGKNLRKIVQRMSEDRWVKVLQTADSGDGQPPMPWWNTAQMSERDLRAMYRYVKSLGTKENGIPRSLRPGKEPTGPYISLEPRQPAEGK